MTIREAHSRAGATIVWDWTDYRPDLGYGVARCTACPWWTCDLNRDTFDRAIAKHATHHREQRRTA